MAVPATNQTTGTKKSALPTIDLMKKVKMAKTDEEKNKLLSQALAKAKANGSAEKKTHFEHLRKLCKTEEEKSELQKAEMIRQAEEARWSKVGQKSGVNDMTFPVFANGFETECPNLRGNKPRRSLTKQEIENGLWGIENTELAPTDANARAFPLRTFEVVYKATNDPLSATAVESNTDSQALREKIYTDEMQFWKPIAGEAAWKVPSVSVPLTIQELDFNDTFNGTQLCADLREGGSTTLVTEIDEGRCGWRCFMADIIKEDKITKKQAALIAAREKRGPIPQQLLEKRMARMARNFAIRRSVPKYLSPRPTTGETVKKPCAEFFGECVNVFSEKDVPMAIEKMKIAEETQEKKLVELGSKFTVLQRVNGKTVTPVPTDFEFKSPQQHAIKNEVMHKREEERIKKMADIRARMQ